MFLACVIYELMVHQNFCTEVFTMGHTGHTRLHAVAVPTEHARLQGHRHSILTLHLCVRKAVHELTIETPECRIVRGIDFSATDHIITDVLLPLPHCTSAVGVAQRSVDTGPESVHFYEISL